MSRAFTGLERKLRDRVADELRGDGKHVQTEYRCPAGGLVDIAILGSDDRVTELIEVKPSLDPRGIGQLMLYAVGWNDPAPTLTLLVPRSDGHPGQNDERAADDAAAFRTACDRAGIRLWVYETDPDARQRGFNERLNAAVYEARQDLAAAEQELAGVQQRVVWATRQVAQARRHLAVLAVERELGPDPKQSWFGVLWQRRDGKATAAIVEFGVDQRAAEAWERRHARVLAGEGDPYGLTYQALSRSHLEHQILEQHLDVEVADLHAEQQVR